MDLFAPEGALVEMKLGTGQNPVGAEFINQKVVAVDFAKVACYVILNHQGGLGDAHTTRAIDIGGCNSAPFYKGEGIAFHGFII